MRARDGTERQNQRDQHGSGRDGIGKESNRDISAGQPFTHDAGPDDGGQKECRSQGFSYCAPDHSYAFAVGFTARMNALMNLSWTCGAIASTSMPSPVRNWRASSTP